MSENLENLNLAEIMEKQKELEAAKQKAVAEQASKSYDGAGTVVDTSSTDAPTTETNGVPNSLIDKKPTLPHHDPDAVDTGSGIIVNTEEALKPEPIGPAADQLDPDRVADIEKYMNDMDSEIEEKKKLKEEHPELFVAPNKEETAKKESDASDEDDDEEEVDPEFATQEMNKKFEEAVVTIDKIGKGRIINFSEAEHEKLEKVSKIRLEEIETIKIKSFRTKRAKRSSLKTLLKKQTNTAVTPIVLPASGYTVSLSGASTYELVSMMGGGENNLTDTTKKWSTIHSKIVETSLGDLDYDAFMKATASIDYNALIYGILCSTYPEDDTIPLTCDKCGNTYEHAYSLRTLLRAEKINDSLKGLIANAVDNSYTKESATAWHEKAPVNQVTTIVLPQSGYVVDLCVQSAYDLINKSIKQLGNIDEKYNQAAVMSVVISAFYTPDPESPGDYITWDAPQDVTEIIYALQDKDIVIISKKSEELLDDITFDFGLMNVKCPKCGDYHETVPFDIESILFYRYQQALSTNVE